MKGFGWRGLRYWGWSLACVSSLLLLGLPRAASGAVAPSLQQVIGAVSEASASVTSFRASFTIVESDLMPDGNDVSAMQMTGTILFSRPNRMKLVVADIRGPVEAEQNGMRPAPGGQTPFVMLYRDEGEVVFSATSGLILEPLESLHPDSRHMFNRWWRFAQAMAANSAKLVDTYTASGDEFMVLEVTPATTTPDLTLTAKNLTLTIDATQAVVTKAEELVSDTDDEGNEFNDIPETTTYEYADVGGTKALSRAETLCDRRILYGSDENPTESTFVPYQRHSVSTFSNIEVNPVLPDSEFAMPPGVQP